MPLLQSYSTVVLGEIEARGKAAPFSIPHIALGSPLPLRLCFPAESQQPLCGPGSSLSPRGPHEVPERY